ncbi:roadblock/LC7 domain-containing protein [Streptomyces scabiei]|nr:roadblock/LC7 domain-containing protein [Streptomyces scabiei]MDX2531552.1 roadblock/LC7 domain-containing protein [Streptomyces scabiei]MDX2796610.1 roadblock/LC7 domain-containing protein [Streptomyces scabiei]MDX3824602.1 roadblock/LC7 domain-containing protein [Streptomyces scabiei]
MTAYPEMSRPDLRWMLDELVNVPHARHAVLLSTDGLAVAASDGVGRVLAETISATTSGLQALSRNGAAFVSDLDTPWQQTMVQYRDGYLFVIAAGDGSYLVASADSAVEIDHFAYAMADIVKRLSDAMTIAPRPSTSQG